MHLSYHLDKAYGAIRFLQLLFEGQDESRIGYHKAVAQKKGAAAGAGICLSGHAFHVTLDLEAVMPGTIADGNQRCFSLT